MTEESKNEDSIEEEVSTEVTEDLTEEPTQEAGSEDMPEEESQTEADTPEPVDTDTSMDDEDEVIGFSLDEINDFLRADLTVDDLELMPGLDDVLQERYQLQIEVEALKDKVLRVSAEYQNFMRRSRDELQREKNLTKANMIKSIIPMIDHFDLALGNVPDTPEAKAVADGVSLVKDEFVRAFEQQGVTLIKPEPGQEFNPGPHEAIMQQPAEGIEKNHITMVLQPGYQHGDLILRAAKVAVAP